MLCCNLFITLNRKIRKQRRYMKRFAKYNLKVDKNAKQFLIGRSSLYQEVFFLSIRPRKQRKFANHYIMKESILSIMDICIHIGFFKSPTMNKTFFHPLCVLIYRSIIIL